MSYDPAAVAARFGVSEAVAAQTGLLNLDYLDPGLDGIVYTGDDTWTLAVAGNIGSSNEHFEGVMPWDNDMGLGDYGVDTASHTVWAVVNHTGDFGIVPEPSSVAMLLAVAAAVFACRRMARR